MGHLFGEAVPLDVGGGQSCARCPAGPAPEMASVLSLQEENQLLQQELSRVEDLLAQSRAERDELAIKYSAVSERVGAAGCRAPQPWGWEAAWAACRGGKVGPRARRPVFKLRLCPLEWP